MLKRFVFPLNYNSSDASTSANEVLNFEDYNYLKSVAWVGSHGSNLDLEIRTHDGKDVILDSVPLDYLKLGNGREEVEIERILANNSIRILPVFETGADIKGSLVFTLTK
jgi:hypothetical protein